MRRKLKTEACPFDGLRAGSERSRRDRRQKMEDRRRKIIVRPSSLVPRLSSGGFTLTEVIMASALLVIAMVPILKALTIGHVTHAIIQRRSQSLMLAQSKLDEIRARSIYDYTGGSFTQRHLSLDGQYLCNIDDEYESSNLRKITISVGYDLNGNNRLTNDEIEVTLATYFARRW
jgi:prepilin-type N-terminal cleavage/methylation domain-containing protein